MRTPRLPARSLWLRLAAAIVIPLAFFATLEAGLRVGGFGYDTRFFIPDGQPGVFRTNPRFTERFFPASFGLKPVDFRLTKHKPANTTRVFVLGESAAMGVPEPAFGLAPHLRAFLRVARPEAGVEVHNLGVTAINSHVVLEIARESLAFSPDLLVVYMGNNEVVGPYGASSVVTAGTPPRALIRAALRLRATRTGQLLQRVAGALGSSPGFREWSGMEMFAGRAVASDDPALARVRDHFSANLEDLLEAAEDAGVPVLLSTVAVNVRDHAPFASLPSPVPALAVAHRSLALEDDAGARAQLETVLQEYPRHAEAHFMLARLAERAGEAAVAERHYIEAWRHDALRFRADEEINARIRSAATNHPSNVTLVDAAGAMGASTSAPNLAGFEDFFEHVHLTQAGNARLARLFAGPAARTLWSLDPDTVPWPDAPAVAAAVGFTAAGERAQLLAMQELTGRPPFTGQFTFSEDRSRLEEGIARATRALGEPGALKTALEHLELAVRGDAENPVLRLQAVQVALQAGDLQAAEAHLQRAKALRPPSPEIDGLEAFLLHRSGRSREAIALLRRTADDHPYYFQTYTLLAALWSEAGDVASARAWFAERVERWPESRVLRAAYGHVLLRAGDLRAAEEAWRTVIAASPDDERSLAPLVGLLVEQERLDDARALMKRAFEVNPRSYANNERLVQLAEHEGDRVAQRRYLQALAESGPVDPRLFLDLARLCAEAGLGEDARIALLSGRRRAQASGSAALTRTFEVALGEGKAR